MELKRDFGINKQAKAVMNYLDDFDFADDSLYHNVYPWYNGRETGICISLKHKSAQAWQHIAFFEHRNSDDICCLRWKTNSHYWNHPLEDPDIFDKAYSGGNKYSTSASFHCGCAADCAQWVYEQFETFYNCEIEEK